ncbi:hypothetical protein MYAM1_003453 [Malassezia yamatoensis]|uniref:Major allergen Mal f 1 n=1 Tax=Malassezia yamatoensis TaxID=253288 RepID=A0AAJ5YWA6_9BASI|nr:hypothetical protein MYAM1_003453 [Malassezia yamatoensis]
MRTTFVLSAVAAILCACSTAWAASLPDPINVNIKNLSPEDLAYDRTRQLFYLSNLWKGEIAVWDPKRQSHFNVQIDGLTNLAANGDQQMSGLSLDKHTNAKRLYAVAKNSRAFNFNDQSKSGPSTFHAFDLPLNESSKPVWSIDIRDVQSQFKQKYGTRPFGIVDSAQDNDGNSYVIFALGAPAIAKVTRDGKISPWAFEQGNGGQRPGYTGIAFDPATNKLLAFGGPRALTAFNVKASNPQPHAVTINGSFGTLDGTEKLAYVPVNGQTVMVGARAPYAISFRTNDNWSSASIKKARRNELKNSGFTGIVDYYSGNQQGVYGSSAFFSEGSKGGRTEWPLYKLDSSILQ